MLLALKQLVMAFADDDGLPESVYYATRALITTILGVQAVTAFVLAVDATDGKFYTSMSGEELWKHINSFSK